MKKYYHIAFLALFFLATSCKTVKLARVDTGYVSITSDLKAEDPIILEYLKPYRDSLNKEMNVIIGENANELSKGRPESTLGNLVADIILLGAENHSGEKIDFAIQNLGGIRIPTLAAGSITKGKIFELMPFDNIIVILKIKGNDVKTLIDLMAKAGGWPVSKGLQVKMNDSQAISVLIQGEPLNMERTYLIAMPDFIANGGDDMDFLKSLPQIQTGVLIRDEIIKYFSDQLKKNEEISVKIEGRMVKSKE